MATAVQAEVLDLRHFSAAALRPLLEEESRRWSDVLHWDYRSSIELLLGYLNQHMLPGYCILENGRPAGYAFAVYEGHKAVIGDVFAGSGAAPGAEALLVTHLVETLQASPGISRIEAQLLLHEPGTMSSAFLRTDFRRYARLLLECDIAILQDALGAATSPEEGLRIRRWEDADFEGAAELIPECYAGHIDAEINQQYRSTAGAQRFLHNVVRFPGCGFFDASASRIAELEADRSFAGMLLCSRVRDDTAHITQLCVLPEMRRRGLGRQMLRSSIRRLASDGFSAVTLTVTEANAGAVAFYRERGFTVRHRFEAFTWDG